MILKNNQVLLPSICDYVTLYGKKIFKDFQMKILSGLSSQTGNIITIILVKKETEGDLTTGKRKAK